MLVPAVLVVWFLKTPSDPGVRTRFVWPGSAVSISGGGLTLEVAPALQAENVQARLGSMSASADCTFIICHEECKHEIVITAGRKGLRSADLRYALLDAKGQEVSAGTLWPDKALEANEVGKFTIGDFALERASKIVLAKVEK
jgi:hypothetical protein